MLSKLIPSILGRIPAAGTFLGTALLLSGPLLAAPQITGVEVKRIDNLPGAIALVFHQDGALSGERLRVYFDTKPRNGEPNTGADYLIEGPSFYAYPENGEGWTWNRVGTPIFQQKDGDLICIVSNLEFKHPFNWFAEVTTSDWNVSQRWPENGTTRVTPSTLAAMEQPATDGPAIDVTELLKARPKTLSVVWNGGPNLTEWSPISNDGHFTALAPTLKSLGFPAGTKPLVRLRDAKSGQTATPHPLATFKKDNAIAWKGRTLDIDWVLLAEPTADNDIRFTGWLAADGARVVRVETGLSLPLSNAVWVDDIANRRTITAEGGIYGNFAGGRYGIDARQSYYPIGVVERGTDTWVAETSPDEPRVFALSADNKSLTATYDLALSPETSKFPGQATFRTAFYRVDRGLEDGFRAALARFYQRHPDYNERRVPHSGLWMPFTDIGSLPHPEDFGFSFFEKVGDVGADVSNAREHGSLTLMYTEPWLYWLPFNDDETRTPARALEKMLQVATLGSGWARDLASSGLAGATRDANGDILTKFMDLPWNKGARMEVSSDPDLATSGPNGLNRAAAEWKKIAPWIADERVDGIYLDSMDAIVQPDHAPAALHAADFPATYTPGGLAPVMAPNVPQYEFVAALAKVLRDHGKFLMANFPLVDAPFINRWIDIPGEETDWWSGGRYNPNSRARLDYRRALSGQKPFGFLQSTDFATFKDEPLRRYFETCLFYGFLPSFFSHNAADNPYWQDHELLERDRHLFRTFIPLTRRVADAGWQPVREARLSDSDTLRFEQFGRSADGLWHLTLQNESEARHTTEITFPAGMKSLVWLDPRTGFGGWVSGGEKIPVTLDPHGMLLLDLVSPAKLGDENAFLTDWRSGDGESGAALKTLDSLRREHTAGIRAAVAPSGPVITGESSDWTLTIRNNNPDTISLSKPGDSPVNIAAGAEQAVTIHLPGDTDGARELSWTITLPNGEKESFNRSILVRAVPPVEVVGPGPRILAREEQAQIPVRLINHTETAREVELTWSANDIAPARRTVKLTGESEQTVVLPLARPAAGGAVELAITATSGGKVWWNGATRAVFLDALASLASEAGVQVTADSTFGGYSTKPLNDGIADTANLAWNEGAWASEDAPAEHWVRLAFPRPTPIREVVIHWHREDGVTYTGREGMILGEVATGQELVLANWKSTPDATSTRITFPLQPLKTIRVVQNSGQGVSTRPGIMWVSEIEVN